MTAGGSAVVLCGTSVTVVGTASENKNINYGHTDSTHSNKATPTHYIMLAHKICSTNGSSCIVMGISVITDFMKTSGKPNTTYTTCVLELFSYTDNQSGSWPKLGYVVV